MMYQGTALITVLNWTGLVVNGVVAFVLPLVLVISVFRRRRLDDFRRAQIEKLAALGLVRAYAAHHATGVLGASPMRDDIPQVLYVGYPAIAFLPPLPLVYP